MFEQVYKQWTLRADKENYTFFNVGPDGLRRFYMVKQGPYGNPVIVVEPDLAFDVPEALTYVDAKGLAATPDEKIGGIVCQTKAGEIIHRFSLSSAQAPKFVSTASGIKIGDVEWHLAVLFSKDKNRIINYDAFYVPQKPEAVKLLELADLNFGLLL